MPTNTSQRPPRNPNCSKLARHARKCIICNHSQRDAIEREFLAWQSPTAIAANYALYDRRPIYRHARATGLFRRRARGFDATLQGILERAFVVRPTPQTMIRAVELYAHINGIGVGSSAAANRQRRKLERQIYRLHPSKSNRHTPRLENSVTHGESAK